ncbi:MAG TPA: DNA methyltransferase [Candidatus Binatia bacterium]|nr:DNA methyltransferase [Candidatus Binatia bacterium]
MQVDGQTYPLRAFAEKRGVQIFLCQPDGTGQIPDRNTRQKIEKQVTKSAYEHLIIFIDNDRTTQIWQWVARQPGQPAAYHEYPYHPQQQSGEALIQKLNAIIIPLDEEEALDLTGTIHKLRDAFDRDRVTKRFYDHFQREHTAFLEFISGITEQGDREWYASLMLNRLMFVYFIQKKGFLDGDTHYLRNRLQTVQEHKGKGKFHTFYRYFLLALFHEGFAKQPKDRKLDADLVGLLSDVPYLNGGLFEVHQLEELYPTIDIPDEAFENLFAFFDQYDWTLDTRPLRNDREINPDVLGYIFEKYINQKEMGAYYTKEDITEYIAKNTILPHLFDAAEKKCAVAFQPNSALSRLLQDDPNRYIYPAVRQGVIDEHGEMIPESTLPEFVQKGTHDPKARMFNKEYNLGQAPISDGNGRNLALPTETWREYVARQQHCLELQEKLQDGAICQINDLITYNLNIRQFAEDVIDTCEGPELLRAFYQAISSITVLDPTCGSGAFLFAALNILEPLYEACLDRMQAFVEDLERSGERHSPKKFEDFRKVLAEAERHPNRSYFILKSIIINNLYGVDIMEEAVEICKLRLFLKLVAQVDKVKDLEPLPDIDFNIRVGNTLVGFVSLEEIRCAAEQEGTQLRLISNQTEKALRRIEEEAEIVERAFQKFHEMQTEHGMDARAFVAQKQELRQRLKRLAEELDHYLAGEYGINPAKSRNFEQWRETHQPFHWFAEFYGIMHQGGFDVIIGNPPYVVYSSSKVPYRVEPLGYNTLETKNLYAYVFERSTKLAKPRSLIGLIVQLTALSSGKLPSLQDLLVDRGALFALPFPRRPESMFDGVEMPVAILLSTAIEPKQFITSRVGRIYTEERPNTVATTSLIPHTFRTDGCRIAKIGRSLEKEIYGKLAKQNVIVDGLTLHDSEHVVYYQEACRYWLKAFPGTPYFKRNGKGIAPPHGRFLYFKSSEAAAFVGCLLNSSLFYWYYSVFSDCEHVNDGFLRKMPIPEQWKDSSWSAFSKELVTNLAKHATRKTIRTKQGHTIEYDEMKAMLSKDAINKVDVALGKCYGLTEEEIDFIINYDIKYRMSADDGNEE